MLSLMIALALSAQPKADGSETEKALAFIKSSQVSNLSQLQFGTFEFEVVAGNASSLERALAGDIENPVTAVGRYCFDADNAVYRLKFSDSDILSNSTKLSDTDYSVKYYSVQALTDRKTTCLEISTTTDLAKQIVGHTAEMFKDEDQSVFQRHFSFIIPLGFGNSETRLLADLTAWKNKTVSVTDVNLDYPYGNSRTVRIVFESESKTRRIYIVDPEKGSLPIVSEDRDAKNNLVRTSVLSDLVYCADRSWLPKARTDYYPSNGTAKTINLKTFDVQHKPVSSEFHLDFDDDVTIPDPMKGVTYNKMRRISLLDKGALKSHVEPATFDQPSSANIARPLVMPGEQAVAWYRWPLALAITSSVIVCVAVFFRRMRA
jgi:hypothetical protein